METRTHTKMPTVKPTPTRAPGGLLQRKCDCGTHTTGGGECDGCGKKRLQRRASSQTGPAEVPSVVHDVLQSPGQPLDAGARAFMEPRFDHDFSRVRVHTGARAAESARAVGALAYTVGRDVVFGAGQYQPGTVSGNRLLAHELTHVMQQGDIGSGPQTKLVIGEAGDAAEREADRTAEAVVAGRGRVPSGFAAPAAPALRRACGPAPIGTPLGCVPRSPTFVTGGSLYKFNKDCDEFISPVEEASLGALPATLPAAATVEIHGFASNDGDPTFNENLSCARVLKAETVLAGGGLGGSRVAGRFSHGGTSGPAAERRSVVILPATPAPAQLTTRRFRAAAVSFLSCAECNPFTDDGAFGLAPPATEPAPGTSFRQLHHVEAELGTFDGRTIAPGTARLVGAGNAAGVSHFCGSGAPANIVSSFPPGAATPVSDPVHGQGIQFRSVLSTRVGATVPATLPGSPCGPLGSHPLIPVIGNSFTMRLFADGHKESAFTSATLYPSHYLYEDRALKVNAAGPVHPRQDFYAWASSTAPLAIGLIGFKALRYHCCHPTLSTIACPTTCVGGYSVPPPVLPLAAPCATHAATLAAMSCPTMCAPAGAACPPIVRGPNP